MPGRIFPDEPEEEYQARLKHQRDFMASKGHSQEFIDEWAELILECHDETDVTIIKDLEAAQKALKPSL